MGTSRSRRCLHDSRGSGCGRCAVRFAPEIRITHPRSARVLTRLVIPIDVRMSLSCHVHGASRAIWDENDPLSRREPFVSSREASEDPPHDPIVHQAQGWRKASARARCREQPRRSMRERYEASRAARRRRFSSAVALRARSAGVARASEMACCFSHLVRSAFDISRITRSPDATCELTWSSFAWRASCSRSVRVFATV